MIYLVLNFYFFLLTILQIRPEEMKFNSEYRLFLFILIPFIVLLVIHIITPLMLLLNSQPISIKAYEEFNIDAIHSNSRSYLQKQGEELASSMSRFAGLGSRLGAMLTKKWSNIGNPTKKINNAYEYFEGIGRSEVNHSMWFANNKLSVLQLNSQQKNLYERYCQVQPYLISSGFGGYSGQVTGIFVSFNLPNSQIAFHYPSYPQTYYKNISASIITQPHNLVSQSPTTYRFNTVSYGSNFNNDTTSLCSAIKNNTEIIGVICVEISLQVLLKETIDEFQVNALNKIGFNLQLIEPTADTLLSQMYHFQEYSELSYPKDANWTYFDNYWDASACRGQLKPVDFYTTVRYQTQTANVIAICLGGSQQKPQPPTLLYSLTFKLKNLSSDLVEAYTYSQVVKTLLIPILISIVISIVVTVIILRYILNDLDFELIRINEYCKFIVSGDSSIKIPEFVGTQEITQLYERVKIINRLFKYTSKQYFTGYYSNKILKYVEAIQLFNKLNYDPSFLYENIGDSYLYIQQYEKAINYLKQSIEIVQNQIVSEYGSLQKVMQLKLEKEFRFSQTYKENQIIIIRRLWKIFFVYMKYVQLGMLNSKNFFGQNLSEEQKKDKKDRYHSEMIKYVTKMKQIMYPDYGLVAEGALLFLFEARFNFNCKNYEAGKSCLEKAIKYVNIYSKDFDSIGNKIKEKGSKNKFFFKKNKMTGHSRCKPQICKAFLKNIEAISKVFHPKKKDYTGSIEYLFDALRSNYISQSVNFMIMSQIRKQLCELKIGMSKFQNTHIFRQMMPYKTLHYGPITAQVEPLLYRIPKSVAEVQLRQFLFMYDTASLQYPSAYCQKHISYMKQRSEFIFQKYVKLIDRVSITKFNNVSQLETGCNLTLKEFNEQILKKTFKDYLTYSNFIGKTWLINALRKIIYRVKNLQCQKVILVFLRPIQSFENDIISKKFRPKSKTKKLFGKIEQQYQPEPRTVQVAFPEVGEEIIELMKELPMRNCRLILMCSVMDEISDVIRVFGLKDINRRIWANTDGLNKNNNTVYIVDDKHKADIQRLLASKLANYADNHIFIFGYKP